jgi:succinate dehydrogenase / fumarate reductase membrane anchor subunit
MSERYSSFEPKGTRWFLQRVTAAILVVLLAFHFVQLHFLNHAADVTFQGSRLRMENVAYFLTMVLFLVTAAFHGVNGVYNALVNQGLEGTPKTVIKRGLIVAGTVLVLQGIRVALAMSDTLIV